MGNTRAVTALVAAGILALGGCGGGGEGAGDDDSGPKVEPAPADVSGDPDTWPLTGLMVDGDDTSVQRHPVLVVKMDNTRSSSPQAGLGSADLVVEELVEGGLTRLAVFYYSELPEQVGPVRSMRASDIGIAAPVDGHLVTSGAAAVTLSRINEAGLTYFSEGSAGFSRSTTRSAPYNVMVDLTDVGDAAKQRPGRPVDYLPFATDADLPDGQPATTVNARFSNSHVTNWRYAEDGYVNENSYAAAGDEFAADTVLVLRVPVGDAGYRDPAGNFVPETTFSGSGEAWVFHGGRLVRAEWSKDGLNARLRLETVSGKLELPPGRTWIELIPVRGGDVQFSG